MSHFFLFFFLHQSPSINDDPLYIFTLFIFIAYCTSPGCSHSMLIHPLKSRHINLPRTKKRQMFISLSHGTFERILHQISTAETFKIWHRQKQNMKVPHTSIFCYIVNIYIVLHCHNI